MTVMTTRAEMRRELTEDDLAAMPDDGRRHELVDGSLIVTPGPRIDHQGVVAELYTVLREACPPDLRVLFAPVDVRLSETTVLQPDLLVAPRAAFGTRNLPGVPLLAVEVLSPSTRHVDLGLKRSRYEAAGAASYWIVDPAVPRVVAWELREGAYAEAGRADHGEALDLDLPFPVRLVPAALVVD